MASLSVIHRSGCSYLRESCGSWSDLVHCDTSCVRSSCSSKCVRRGWVCHNTYVWRASHWSAARLCHCVKLHQKSLDSTPPPPSSLPPSPPPSLPPSLSPVRAHDHAFTFGSSTSTFFQLHIVNCTGPRGGRRRRKRWKRRRRQQQWTTSPTRAALQAPHHRHDPGGLHHEPSHGGSAADQAPLLFAFFYFF